MVEALQVTLVFLVEALGAICMRPGRLWGTGDAFNPNQQMLLSA